MDFEFTPEQPEFVKEVEQFLDDNYDPEVFDVTRENMAQIVDTPSGGFMACSASRVARDDLARRVRGKAASVYEYLLNEALAGRGGPQIGKGVGIIGKTIISHGSETLKSESERESEREREGERRGREGAQRGLRRRVDAAEGDKGRGRRGRLKGEKTRDHFGPLRRLVSGGRPHRPRRPEAHRDHPLPGPVDRPDHRQRHLDDGRRADQRGLPRRRLGARRLVVGELNRGFQYISEALDLERFTLFTYSPTAQRLELLTEYVKGASRDGEPMTDDPVVRSQVAPRHAEAEVARVIGLKFVSDSWRGGPRPTSEASEYKLFTTELSRRLANASMDLAGPGGSSGPDRGRPDGRPRQSPTATRSSTPVGDSSEVQKNILARRKLGLPKNF